MITSNIENTERNEREYSIDVVKALLIFLVVWGHAIQYLHGTDFNYWESPLYKFIYGFHMPLFALVSGHLMAGSYKRYSITKLFQKKSKQLLIPTICWELILTIIDIVLNVITHENNTVIWIVMRFINRCINDLWFLKAIFLTFLIVVLVEKCFKGNLFVYFILSLFTLMLPKNYNLAYYGYLLPFYIIGFKFGTKTKIWNNSLSRKNRLIIFVLCALAYILMLVFFHKDNYIYTTGLCVIDCERGTVNQLLIDSYRIVVATVGCIMMLEGCSLINKQRKFIAFLSNKTMVIYIITASVFTYVPQLIKRLAVRVLFERFPSVIIDLLLFIPLSIILILFSLLCEYIIKKIRMSALLFGK